MNIGYLSGNLPNIRTSKVIICLSLSLEVRDKQSSKQISNPAQPTVYGGTR